MNNVSKARVLDRYMAGVRSRQSVAEVALAPRFSFHMRARRNGVILWEDTAHNLVVNGGLDSLLNVYFDAATQITTWYLGLKGTGSVAAADTLASHAGWAEITDYAGNRQAITFGTTSGGSLDGNTSTFAINATVTIAGAMIASVASGTSGLLYSAGNFAAPRSLANGDELDVTPTVTMAAA